MARFGIGRERGTRHSDGGYTQRRGQGQGSGRAGGESRRGAAETARDSQSWDYPHNLRNGDGVVVNGRPARVDQVHHDGQMYRGTVDYVDGQSPGRDNVALGNTTVETIDLSGYGNP